MSKPEEIIEMLEAQKKSVETAHTKLQKDYTDLDGKVGEIDKQLKAANQETVEAKTAFQDQVEKVANSEADLDALNKKVAELEGMKGQYAANEDPMRAAVQKAAEHLKGYRGGNMEIATVNQGAFDTKAFVATDDGSGNEVLTRPERQAEWVMNPEQPLLIRDLLTVTPTSSDSVEWVLEKTFTNNAGPQVKQGDAKPESTIEFELQSTSVITLAHWMAYSRQAIADVPRLQSVIEGRMRYGLRHQEEQQILFGGGAAGNLNGIMPQATPYAAAAVVGDTNIDLIRRAILQSTQSYFPCDAIAMSHKGWMDIELTKTDDKAYLFANPANPTAPRLWGRRVVEAFSMPDADFLCGGFSTGATLYDREQTTARIAEQHEDFFVKNLVALLLEERIMLAVERPAAFIKGTFA